MSKKHFRALADKFNSCLPLTNDKEQYDVWYRMVEATADVCAQCNPNFNRAKFIQACEEGL